MKTVTIRFHIPEQATPAQIKDLVEGAQSGAAVRSGLILASTFDVRPTPPASGDEPRRQRAVVRPDGDGGYGVYAADPIAEGFYLRSTADARADAYNKMPADD